MATDRMDKNAEGYADPTAGGAWNNIREKERRKEAARMTVISNLIPILKQTAELAGFEVVGAYHPQRQGERERVQIGGDYAGDKKIPLHKRMRF